MKAISHRGTALLWLGLVLCGSAAMVAETGEQPSKGRLIELEQVAGEGDDKEVSVLLDERYLKLAKVILRRGTTLPPHATPVAATIQVLEGEGVMHLGEEAVAVSRGALVVLPAGLEHDVIPAPGSDMVLLVHYLRGSTAAP